MRDIVRLLRPHHWIKNGFCFGGLFFGGFLLDSALLVKSVWVFVGFCCLSSAVYLFNDVHDRETDRLHPRKRNRPLAKGTVSVRGALCSAAALVAAGFAALVPVGERVAPVAATAAVYLVLHIAYTLWLKKIPLVDVNVIAIGFILRVAAGAFAVGVIPTPWILLCTYFLALFLAIGKRRAELVVMGGDRENSAQSENGRSRRALQGYSLSSLDFGLIVCAALVILTYTLYCVTSHRQITVMATIIPVAFGILRYLAIARDGDRAETPEKLVLHDRVLKADIAVWAVLFFFALYGNLLFQ